MIRHTKLVNHGAARETQPGEPIQIRKDDAYHAMNCALTREHALHHVVSTQLCGQPRRGDPLSQAPLYEHILAGILVARREFAEMPRDVLAHILRFYAALYRPVLNLFTVVCGGCSRDYHNERSERSLLDLVSGDARLLLCHGCRGLCFVDAHVSHCRVYYCRDCLKCYCANCAEPTRTGSTIGTCVLCGFHSCLSHMVASRVCRHCMHPKPSQIHDLFGCVDGPALCCLHPAHRLSGNHYDHVYRCPRCNASLCAEHYSGDASSCIVCVGAAHEDTVVMAVTEPEVVAAYDD